MKRLINTVMNAGVPSKPPSKMKNYPKDTRYVPSLKMETQTLWLKPSTEPSIEPFTLENTIGRYNPLRLIDGTSI